jgi:hypothetical protein
MSVPDLNGNYENYIFTVTNPNGYSLKTNQIAVRVPFSSLKTPGVAKWVNITANIACQAAFNLVGNDLRNIKANAQNIREAKNYFRGHHGLVAEEDWHDCTTDIFLSGTGVITFEIYLS